MAASCGMLLTEDLGRQCFVGYEDADAEELRGMVQLFSARAAQASSQQRRTFDRLTSSAESLCLAQKRLQQLHDAEVMAEERAELLEEASISNRQAYTDFERSECTQLLSVRSELKNSEQKCITTESFLAESTRLAEELAGAAERARGDLAEARSELASQAEARWRIWRLATTYAEEEVGKDPAEFAAERSAGSAEAWAAVCTEGPPDRLPAELTGGLDPLLDSLSFTFSQCQSLRLSQQSAVSSDLRLSELGLSGPLSQDVLQGSLSLSQSQCQSLHQSQKSATFSNSHLSEVGLAISGSMESRLGFNTTTGLGQPELDAKRDASPTCTVHATPLAPRAPAAMCITQDPAAAPTSRTAGRTPCSFPSRVGKVSATARAAVNGIHVDAAGDDGNVTFTAPRSDVDEDSFMSRSPSVKKQDVDVMAPTSDVDEDSVMICSPSVKKQDVDVIARAGGSKASGLRYLLGRKQPQHPVEALEFSAEEVADAMMEEYSPEVEAEEAVDAKELAQASFPTLTVEDAAAQVASPHDMHTRASWAGAISSRVGASTDVLVDKLFDECLAREGGQLQGAASVRRVLLDLAGEEASVPPELDALLCQLGSSLNADVSRTQFRLIVSNALALRQSQEISHYEATGSSRVLSASLAMLRGRDSCADGDGGRDAAAPLVRASARSLHRLAALPSWSVELSRLSGGGNAAFEAHGVGGGADDGWAAVEGALGKIRSLAEGTQQSPGGALLPELLCELEEALRSFVHCFADEARGRLRAAHASTGRLLEQRRCMVDDISAQLEVRDALLQQASEEHANLSVRLRAADERAAFAERLAADTAGSLAACQALLVQTEASAIAASKPPPSSLTFSPAKEALGLSVASLPADHGNPAERSLSGLAELASALRAELDDADQRFEAADDARRRAEAQVQDLEQRYREDMLTVRDGVVRPSSHLSLSSSLSGLPQVQSADAQVSALRPGPLLEELKSVAQNSVQETLRGELQLARDELELRWEEESYRRQEDDAVSATAAAAVEQRLSEMHAGAFFGKVSFKRNLKQPRYVRLTFDCRRVEWAQQQRGPFKGIAINSIVRIDYGDASRAFRCLEHGRRDRPNPGLCMSICTPSRSLDLIASSENDIEVWMLALNEIVPYRLERQRFTAQEFLLRRAMLRLELGTAGDQRLDGNDVKRDSSIGSTGTGVLSAIEGVESNRQGIIRGMSGRWGFPTRR